jgi:hypothetical protein
VQEVANVSNPFRLVGLAHAFHSSGKTSPTEGTASSVISKESIEAR